MSYHVLPCHTELSLIWFGSVLTFMDCFDDRYPWETVTQAFWLKYPNPFSTHVLASDIIERYIDREGKLRTKRLLLKVSSVPSWGRSLINVPEAYIIEESVVDPLAASMSMTTSNLSFSALMFIQERQEFHRHPERPEWTFVQTEATFQSKLSWGLRNAIESFCQAKFHSNLAKSRKAILYILDRLRQNSSSRSSSTTVSACLLACLRAHSLFYYVGCFHGCLNVSVCMYYQVVPQ